MRLIGKVSDQVGRAVGCRGRAVAADDNSRAVDHVRRLIQSNF